MLLTLFYAHSRKLSVSQLRKRIVGVTQNDRFLELRHWVATP